MNKADEVARIDRERVEVRLTHARLCEAARVDPATWWRNRNNPETISLDTIDKLEKAIKAKREERAAA